MLGGGAYIACRCYRCPFMIVIRMKYPPLVFASFHVYVCLSVCVKTTGSRAR